MTATPTVRRIDILNGVRFNVVARIVGGAAVSGASLDEKRIAFTAMRIGEKMERQGYLPDLRRKRMLRVIREEALLCVPPEPLPPQNGPAGPGGDQVVDASAPAGWPGVNAPPGDIDGRGPP